MLSVAQKRGLNVVLGSATQLPFTEFTRAPRRPHRTEARPTARITPTLASPYAKPLSVTALARHNGEIREVGEFLLLGRFVASGAYRLHSFAEYKQSSAGRKGS